MLLPGLRADDCSAPGEVPDGCALPATCTIILSAARMRHVGSLQGTPLRLDVLDRWYVMRDGTGVGDDAPRRTVLAGVAQRF